jgi:hypothetical protein
MTMQIFSFLDNLKSLKAQTKKLSQDIRKRMKIKYEVKEVMEIEDVKKLVSSTEETWDNRGDVESVLMKYKANFDKSELANADEILN